jgi:hypothetical protein
VEREQRVQLEVRQFRFREVIHRRGKSDDRPRILYEVLNVPRILYGLASVTSLVDRGKYFQVRGIQTRAVPSSGICPKQSDIALIVLRSLTYRTRTAHQSQTNPAM